MIAGTLEIQMLANLARLSDDMKKAKDIVGSSMKSIEDAVGKAKSVLALLGISVGVGFFMHLIQGTIESTARLEDLHHATGIVVEDLAGMRLLAAQTGTDLGGLAQGINRMSVEMGKAPDKFRELGVTSKDPLEAFKQLSDLFRNLPDLQQRNALAQAIFSRSWAELAPVLSLGSKAIGEVIERGKQLSGITGENAAQAQEYQARMAELQLVLSATSRKIINDSLPALTEISKAMMQAAKEGSGLLAIWVGLGGAFAFLVGLTESQKVAKRLEEINEQVRIAKLQLTTGTLNPEGGNTSFWSWLIPDVKLTDQAKAKLAQAVAALEAERDRLTGAKKPGAAGPAGSKDGMDDKAIAEIIATEKARRFIDAKEIYAKEVAEVRGEAAMLQSAVRTEEEKLRLTYQETGIGTIRAQEELLRQEGELRDRRLKIKLGEAYALEQLAKDKGGPEGQKDAAAAAAIIKQTNQEIAANVDVTEAQVRAARAQTAVQNTQAYNAWLEQQLNMGLLIQQSLDGGVTAENLAYDKRRQALQVFIAERQGAITGNVAWEAQVKAQHEYNLFMIERNRNQAARDMTMQTVEYGIELLQVFAGKNKDAAIAVIVVQKALAIAQVIMNTQVAVMRAYAELGPYAGSAMAAYLEGLSYIQIGLIAATGLAQISNIKKGGGAAPGTPANPGYVTGDFQQKSTAQSQQAPTQTVIIDMRARDDDVFSGRFMRQLLRKVEEVTRDGARVLVTGSDQT